MSTITANYHGHTTTANPTSAAGKVSNLLRLTYGLVPIAAGADKFMHLLVNWDQYLAPAIAGVLPFEAHTFMLIVGVVEIVAGIIVLLRPRLGALIVSLWLVGIAVNLLIGWHYLDVAVRDIVMAIGAFCLYLLSDGRRSE